MFFTQLYSGSSGNLYTVSTLHGKTLLIECGVVYKKLLKALKYDLSSIEACLVTHGHADHSVAAIDLMDNGIDVYATAGTFQEIGIKENCPQWRRAKVIQYKDLIKFPSFQVYVFSTIHDAKQPCGFLIRETATNEFMLFATDTASLEQSFKKYPCKIIALECSYQKDILEARLYSTDEQLKELGLSRVDEALAKRLLTSHLEKNQTKQFIREYCNIDKCVELHLLHLSSENINKQEARQEIENEFKVTTIIKE